MFTMSTKDFSHNLRTNFKKIFASSTVIVTIGILIGSFFSYLLQFLLGRFLSVGDYGTFSALLSLVYLVSVPTSVFGTSIIKMSSELLAKKSWDKLTSLFWKLNLYFFYFGCATFLLVLLLKNQIAGYLNIADTALIIPFGVFLGISYLVIVPGAYLQGLLRFKAFAFYTIVSAFLRMVFPVALILLGFRIYGIFYGFSLSIILAFILGFLLLKKNLLIQEDLQESDLFENYKKILSFSSSVLFINFGLMALNNLDMIMVKRFFDADTAGYYAGTVTLGKIFLFGAGTVATVMFPQISNLYTKKSKLFYSKLKQFFSIQLLLVILGLGTFFVFPKLLNALFFGDRFSHSVTFLPYFSVFIALYILINFMVLFFMAIDRTKVFLLLIVGTVAQYLLLSNFHDSVFQIISINIGIAFTLLTVLSLYFIRIKKQLMF